MVENTTNLSDKERLVLEMLIDRGPLYGLEMVKLSRGELKRGTVYVTLSRMMDKGYVESYEEDAKPGHRGPARRKYRATRPGRRKVALTWSSRRILCF